MSKVAIISDLHFGKRDLDFLNRQLNFFESQVFPYLLENGITDVFQLGDSFDSRKYSLNQMLSEVGTRYFSWFPANKVTLHTIVGNHDSTHKESAKFSPLYQYKNKYIDICKKNKIVEVDNTKFALHSYFCEEFLEADVGLFHHDFIGRKMNKSTINEDGVEFPTIEYKKTYSGHYHGSDDKLYLNTPYQLSFESFGDNNGFMILDTETLEETWIPNRVNQRFVKVYYYSKDAIIVKDATETQTNHIELLNIIKDNVVEFNIENLDDKLIIDDLLEKIPYVEYTYNNYFLNDAQEVDQDKRADFIESDINNISELYDGFVGSLNDLPSDIDKDLLKDEFMEIYHECKIEEA